MRERKYFKSRKEALKACGERNKTHGKRIEVCKMPRGSRHSGQYDVCTFIEYINSD